MPQLVPLIPIALQAAGIITATAAAYATLTLTMAMAPYGAGRQLTIQSKQEGQNEPN